MILITFITLSSHLQAQLPTIQSISQPALTLNKLGIYSIGKNIEYWQDSDNIQDLAELETHAQWQPWHSDNINMGFNEAQFWFRMRVDMQIENPQWFLQNRYSALDTIDLYVCNEIANNKSPHNCFNYVTGDSYPFSQRERKTPTFVLPLPMQRGENFIYIRVKSIGSYQLPFQIIDQDNLNENIANNNLLRGGYYSLMFVMLLYNFFIYLITRLKPYILYTAFVTAFMIFHLAYEGSGFQFLWPNSPKINDYILPLILPFSTFFSLWFVIEFLNMRQHKGVMYRCFQILLALSALSLVLNITLSYAQSLKFQNLVSMLSVIAAFTVSIMYWHKGINSARLFILAWTILLIGIMVSSLRTLGTIPTNLFTLYGYQIGSALEVVLLSLALGARIQKMQNSEITARKESIKHLAQYEELYQNSLSGQFQLDSNFNIFRYNNAMQDLLLLDDRIIIEKSLNFFSLFKDSQSAIFVKQALANNQSVTSIDVELYNQKHECVHVTLNIRHVDNIKNIAWSGSLINITDKVIQQDKDKADQYQRMFSLQQLVTGVSHEMNTPIGNIAMSSSFLNELNSDLTEGLKANSLTKNELLNIQQQQKEGIKSIDSSAQKLGEFTKIFKRVAVQKSDYDLQKININDFLHIWRNNQESKSSIFVQAEDVEIASYPIALMEILNQLYNNAQFHNAKSHSNNSLTINIVVSTHNQQLSLTFSDNGQGVVEDDISRIFLPFYTQTRGIKKSIGLGMYYIYNLVHDLFSGHITARNNSGLELEIILPLVESNE